MNRPQRRRSRREISCWAEWSTNLKSHPPEVFTQGLKGLVEILHDLFVMDLRAGVAVVDIVVSGLC